MQAGYKNLHQGAGCHDSPFRRSRVYEAPHAIQAVLLRRSGESGTPDCFKASSISTNTRTNQHPNPKNPPARATFHPSPNTPLHPLTRSS